MLIGHPLWMRFHPDSFLILQDYGLAHQIKVIDLKNNKVQKVIPEGRGPGEMVIGWGIDIVDKNIFAFDPQLQKIIILTPDSKRKFRITKEYKIDAKYPMEFCPLTKDISVCLCGFEENRLTFLDASGKIVKKVGDFPPFQNDNIIKGDNGIFQAVLTASPEGDMLALANKNIDLVEIFDLKRDKVMRLQGPIGLKYKVNDLGITQIVEPRYDNYFLIISNKSEIWTSYNGYKMEKGTQPSSSDQIPKQIFCFSWEGKPIRQIKLDYSFGGFDVDWSNRILYTLELRDNIPQIISYQLDTKLK
ncbi:MAG: TolB-like 6-bladed beta-propeller domain-containing protein [Bacteroidales bacterium]|nr:TolB-like 6-bladed beta-propeller domain-containing protein [Bacteroidales bacterium]